MANTDNRISRQISIYMTDKKLAELVDKLNPAPITSYAHLHARGDEVNGRRSYSNIGIVLQDYSNGKGENTKRATANLSPDEVAYIFAHTAVGVVDFEFRTDKIFGAPDENGRLQVTKLVIRRANVGSDGQPRRYPWYIEIDNGTGIGQKTGMGGTFCQKDSFKSLTKIYINISDLDFFKLFHRAVQYINAWEATNAPVLIELARTEREKQEQ